MGRDYHCRIKGKDLGPVSAKHLRYLALYNKLSPDDLVREDGTDQWVRVGSLEGLFGEPQSPQPPPPPPEPQQPQPGPPRWRGLFRRVLSRLRGGL